MEEAKRRAEILTMRAVIRASRRQGFDYREINELWEQAHLEESMLEQLGHKPKEE